MTPPVRSIYTTAIFVSASVLNVLAALAVAARIKARRITRVPLAADDYVIIASLAGIWIYLVVSIIGAAVGGVNVSVLEPVSAISWFNKMSFVGGLTFSTTAALVKISIVLFYMRIFGSVPSFKIACYVMIAICSAWGATNIIVTCNITRPIWRIWGGTTDFEMINYTLFVQIYLAMGIALDVITLCMPLPVIRTLHMKTKQKVFIIGIFWLGFFCCIASAVKYYYNYIGNGVLNDIWQHIEVACSVIAACLPTCAPLLREKAWVKRWLAHLSSWYTAITTTRSHSGREREPGSKLVARVHRANSSRETDIQALHPSQEEQFPWSKPAGGHDVFVGASAASAAWELERLPMDGVHVEQSVDLDYSAKQSKKGLSGS